jgi:outer membrane protein OmpA-like peptidoglycan-associated protein
MQVGDDVKVKDVFETRTRGGLGDTEVLLKICPPIPTKYVSVGVLGEASFPTGRKVAGFTTDKTDFGLKGLLTFNLVDAKKFVPMKLHLNLGYRFNRNEEAGYGILYANNPDSSGFYPPAYPKSPKGKGTNFNDVLQFGTGLEFLAKQSSLFVEFTWDDYLNADFVAPPIGDTTSYYLAGNKNIYTITPGVKLVSSNGVGLTLAADFSLNSEGAKSFVHPPDWAVYFILSMGGNVLPQDRDGDGIEDKVDKCPNAPEDFDGFQDEDGCPDLDNDLDGIPDSLDKCPNEPETYNGYLDEDGCPDERPIEEKFILRGVNFESGSAALTPDSYSILDQVVKSLKAYPEVRIEIAGYTDDVGKDDYNLGLSQRRAEAVKQYLANAGINADRVVAKGYGETNPVATNSTPAGRAENRRIEFHRLN